MIMKDYIFIYCGIKYPRYLRRRIEDDNEGLYSYILWD